MEKIKTVSIENESGSPYFVLPDGKYDGIWKRHEVKTSINGKVHFITTEIGVREFSFPVDVIIENGEVWIQYPKGE